MIRGTLSPTAQTRLCEEIPTLFVTMLVPAIPSPPPAQVEAQDFSPYLLRCSPGESFRFVNSESSMIPDFFNDHPILITQLKKPDRADSRSPYVFAYTYCPAAVENEALVRLRFLPGTRGHRSPIPPKVVPPSLPADGPTPQTHRGIVNLCVGWTPAIANIKHDQIPRGCFPFPRCDQFPSFTSSRRNGSHRDT